MAVKRYKVGTVLMKKDRTGVVVALGSEQAKDERYRFTVELVVKDSKGKEVGRTTNGFLSVNDPRTRPNITEDQRAKIPEAVKHELFLVVNEA